MNKERRNKLAQASDLIAQSIAIIEEVRDEEQEAFDNMPEGLQSGERGDRAQEVISNLDQLIDELQATESTFEAAKR